MTKSDTQLKGHRDKKGGGVKVKTPAVMESENENRNEKGTDQFVRDLLRVIGQAKPWKQDGGPK